MSQFTIFCNILPTFFVIYFIHFLINLIISDFSIFSPPYTRASSAICTAETLHRPLTLPVCTVTMELLATITWITFNAFILSSEKKIDLKMKHFWSLYFDACRILTQSIFDFGRSSKEFRGKKQTRLNHR